MASIIAAKRYAKALFELGKSKQVIENLLADMESVKDTVAGSRELEVIMANPVIDAQKKCAILKEVFSKTHQLTHKNFDVLAENDRVEIVGAVAQQFINIYREYKNIKEATVTTATPLNDELRKEVLQKIEELTNSSVTLNERVDEKIIGGFVLNIDDLQYDASVSGRLNTLKKELKTSVAV